jgi:hypothetical protein
MRQTKRLGISEQHFAQQIQAKAHHGVTVVKNAEANAKIECNACVLQFVFSAGPSFG